VTTGRGSSGAPTDLDQLRAELESELKRGVSRVKSLTAELLREKLGATLEQVRIDAVAGTTSGSGSSSRRWPTGRRATASWTSSYRPCWRAHRDEGRDRQITSGLQEQLARERETFTAEVKKDSRHRSRRQFMERIDLLDATVAEKDQALRARQTRWPRRCRRRSPASKPRRPPTDRERDDKISAAHQAGQGARALSSPAAKTSRP